MANKAIIVHKLAQNVRFKGPWDATGKLIKQVIQNNELCNAWDYYIKMKRDLTRNGQEEKTRNLLEYEQNQDILLLNNTPFTTRHIHIGFGTKKLEDLNTLKLHHCNIFYTNRSNIEDMNVVANTLKISQVSGELHPEINDPHQQWKFTTSLIPCSCPSCMIHSISGRKAELDARLLLRLQTSLPSCSFYFRSAVLLVLHHLLLWFCHKETPVL